MALLITLKGTYIMSDDLINKIIRYENGQLDDTETKEMFQEIADRNLTESLPGAYNRRLQDMIDTGQILIKAEPKQ